MNYIVAYQTFSILSDLKKHFTQETEWEALFKN